MALARIIRHLFHPDWLTRRAFPRETLARIAAAIAASEREHSGEIRFSVEGALHPFALWAGKTARQRAVEVFSELHVWDTEANNGVLIYLLLADRDVEIVADRGFRAIVTTAEWEAVCGEMERHFARGEFEAGALTGIAQAHALIARHFPVRGENPNELPDQPAVF